MRAKTTSHLTKRLLMHWKGKMSKKNLPNQRNHLRRTRKDPTPISQRQDFPQIMRLAEYKEWKKLPKEEREQEPPQE
jgi:hypothetical protein